MSRCVVDTSYLLWRTCAGPRYDLGAVNSASAGLPAGDLGPTGFQLEPAVHHASAPSVVRLDEIFYAPNVDVSAATPADACGT